MNERLGSALESPHSSSWHRLNVRSGSCPVQADSPQTDSFWPVRKAQTLAVCATPGAVISLLCQGVSAHLGSASRCDTELSSSSAVMALWHGVTSTNGGCTAAPSFSYSAQTLIVPYFVRYIFIYIYIYI